VKPGRADRICALSLFALGAGLGAAFFLRMPQGARPSIQDEAVYLLQARMLASGRLTYPSPPLPEFFEAAHVLVVPCYAAKYFPGHAAVLAPFVALGVPWLAPCLLFGATLALLFLAARWAQLPPWAGLTAAGLVVGSGEMVAIFGTFLSQTTSVALVAAAIAAGTALRARPTPLRAALLFACAGAAGLVRPFVGAALAVAAAAWLLHLRPRPWRRFAAAALGPLAVAALLTAAVCRATTGSWTVSPWTLYARQYMPFDGPGIGPLRPAEARQQLPPHLARLGEAFLDSRRLHTYARLPAEVQRRGQIVEDLAPGQLVIPFALTGLLWAPLWIASAFALVFFFLQLTFHFVSATYYLEMYPWLALAAAAGASVLLRAAGRLAPRQWAPLLAAPVLLVGLFVTVQGVENLREELKRAPLADAPYARYEPTFAWLRRQRALVFLRYPPEWNPNLDLTYNEPDLQKAQLVRAIDLGPRDAQLLPWFPDRPAYQLDLANLSVQRIR